MPDDASAPEVEEVDVSWLDEQAELELNGNGRVHESSETSARARELSGDHWRQRAVLWRERAIAAELVAKMLQRNLDDLRANLDDLRREAKAVTTAHELDAATHRAGSGMSPWRRFVRDVYDSYLR